MSKISVQCKGSGQPANAGINAKRAFCGVCSKAVDVRGDGKIRKHMRLTTTSALKRGR